MNHLERWSDEQLVTVFGDPGFEDHTQELMRRCEASIRQCVQRRISDREGAVEAEADTWTRMLTGKNTFLPAGKESARVWVYSVADHAAIDWLRRKANAPLPLAEAVIAAVPLLDAGAAEQVETQETAERIHQAVLRLASDEQMILLLTRPGPSPEAVGLGLLTQQQTANLLGCSGPAAVHQRLRSILARLRQWVVSGSTPDDCRPANQAGSDAHDGC